eukprot:Hpha_TRINITY_DN21135_c0_g1::TRINITY_DN21135_c0_g1_i1::g.25205::m.25205
MQNGGVRGLGLGQFPWQGEVRVSDAHSPSPALRSVSQSSPRELRSVSPSSPRDLITAAVRRRLLSELELQTRVHPLGGMLASRFARAGFREPVALAGLLCGPEERRSDTGAFLDIATIVDCQSPQLLRSAGISAQATLRRILARAAADSSSPHAADQHSTSPPPRQAYVAPPRLSSSPLRSPPLPQYPFRAPLLPRDSDGTPSPPPHNPLPAALAPIQHPHHPHPSPPPTLAPPNHHHLSPPLAQRPSPRVEPPPDPPQLPGPPLAQQL